MPFWGSKSRNSDSWPCSFSQAAIRSAQALSLLLWLMKIALIGYRGTAQDWSVTFPE